MILIITECTKEIKQMMWEKCQTNILNQIRYHTVEKKINLLLYVNIRSLFWIS